MQSAGASMFVFIAFAATAHLSLAEETNPLARVIELMDSLAAKVGAQGEAEDKAYKQFVEFCDDASRNSNNEIKTGTDQKGKLEAKIAQLSNDIEAGDTKIGELASALSTDQADLKAATVIRAKEASDFGASEAELVDAVDTLGRAIAVLKREMQKNPAALAQLDNSNIMAMIQSLGKVIDAAFTTTDHQKLLALVQSQQASQDDDAAPGAPAATVYKTHSTDIFDVLEDLKEKAEGQLSDLRKAEGQNTQNFNMLRQSLEDQIAAETRDLDQTKADKAADEEARASSQGELEVTVRDLKSDANMLATTKANCMQTAADHQATVTSRTEELTAIAQARRILVDSTSGAESQTYSLVQEGSRLQTSADLAKSEVLTVVRRLARESHSVGLAQLASRIAAVVRYGAANGDDPFVKVRGLIQDMIAKLQAEAQADATEKAYCDEQIAKTEAKKGELEDDISKLTSKIDTASAKSADLKAQVKELQGELAALARVQSEMDDIRRETHADYETAKAELTQGIQGVQKALGVLRDYYGSEAAAAGAFVQQPSVPVHSKATGAGNSIIDILEVVESDFAKNLAKEESQESDAQSEYDTTTQENSVVRATKDQDVKYKTQEANSLAKSVTEMSADRKAANSELSAVMEYYGKIRERCIAKPEGYEERRRRRAAEIAGLREALDILENEAALVQRKSRGVRHVALARE